MHCGAGEISVLYTLHALIGTMMQQYVVYSTLLVILLTITSMAGMNANLTMRSLICFQLGQFFIGDSAESVAGL